VAAAFGCSAVGCEIFRPTYMAALQLQCVMRALIASDSTLSPTDFVVFDEIVNLPITRSPLLIFPMIALGLLGGSYFTHRPGIKEGSFVVTGLFAMGVSIGILSISVALGLPMSILVPISAGFLVFAGFGIILVMIASRTVLQKRVLHRYQGTIFGANFVLASFLASVMSPFAAGLVALFGYLKVIFIGSLAFLISSAVIEQMRRRWKF